MKPNHADRTTFTTLESNLQYTGRVLQVAKQDYIFFAELPNENKANILKNVKAIKIIKKEKNYNTPNVEKLHEQNELRELHKITLNSHNKLISAICNFVRILQSTVNHLSQTTTKFFKNSFFNFLLC